MILKFKAKNRNRTCANCVKGYAITINNDILCSERGVVSQDYYCRKHRIYPQAKSFKNLGYKCIDCLYFSYNAKNNDSSKRNMGVCQLFSVREFNGLDKKVCSKFVKRKELNISHVP